MKVELLSITPNAESLIASAYGICTGKDTIPLENIQKWIKRGHLSPIEHASASFLIDGISRSCLAQITRHRLSSFSVQSMRYCDVSKNDIIMPDSIKDDEYARVLFLAKVKSLRETYKILTKIGIPKQDARYVLPIGTTTKLIMSSNFRQWRTVIEQRCNKAAQWEIRQVCIHILELLYRESPNVFQDLKERFLDEQN